MSKISEYLKPDIRILLFFYGIQDNLENYSANIARKLGLNPTTTRRHIKELDKKGLVKLWFTSGRVKFYRLTPEGASELQKYLSKDEAVLSPSDLAREALVWVLRNPTDFTAMYEEFLKRKKE